MQRNLSVFDAQLDELRRQQRLLEAEMEAHEAQHNSMMDAIAGAYGMQPATVHSAAYRSPRSGGGNEHANTVNDVIDDVEKPSGATVSGADQPSGKPMKRAPVGESRAAMMKRYLDAISEFPDYQQRRVERLLDVRPFSFERRELYRSKSTSARRTEEEALRREEEIQSAIGFKFQARAVPPSTFLNKYELMVEEWSARKEAIRLLSEERAKASKEQDNTLAFSEAFARQKEEAGLSTRRRSHSQDWRVPPKPFRAREVPAFVKEKSDPEVAKQQELARAARIKFRAEQMLKLAREPPRMAAGKSNETTTSAAGNSAPSAAAVAPSGSPTGGGAQSSGAPATAATTATLRDTTNESAAAKKAKELDELRRLNPNFTFQPNVKPQVPDFDYRWAKDRVALAARKQQRPPTVPKDFPLCVTRDSTRKILQEIREEEATGKETRWPYLSERGPVKPTSPVAPTADRPAGTRAHALAAEATYLRIAELEKKERARLAEAKTMRKQQRALARRLKQFLPTAPEALRAELDTKVREMRRKFKEESRERLQELKQRVQNIRDLPPVFVEPTYLADLATARAATEAQVLKMLKDHGLAEATVSAIMGKPIGAAPSAATADISAPPAVVQATDLAPGTKEPPPAVVASSLVAPVAGTVHVVPLPLSAAPPVAVAAGGPAKPTGSSSSSSSNSSSSSSSSDSD